MTGYLVCVFRRVALVVIAAAALTGCGTIDGHSAASQISHSLAQRFAIAPPAVKCPSGVPSKPGRRFTCTTQLEGQPLEINAVVTGSSGRFDTALGAAVLVVPNAEKTLAADVSKQVGESTTVSCPTDHRLLVKRPGEKFTCNATVGGTSRPITVTVTDVNGNVTYSLGA